MKKRLLITSIVMMLVVAVALSTATYAWFTSNASVTASTVTMTAAANTAEALGIGWGDSSTGVAGTEIVATVSDTLVPMAPKSLVTSTTTFSGEGAIDFNSATIKNINSKAVFNAPNDNVNGLTFNNGSGTDTFFVKNLSTANSVPAIWMRATISAKETEYTAITAEETVVVGYTYYSYVDTNDDGDPDEYQALATQPAVGTKVSTGFKKMNDGSELVRIAVFQKSNGAYKLIGVLSKTAGNAVYGTIAQNSFASVSDNTAATVNNVEYAASPMANYATTAAATGFNLGSLGVLASHDIAVYVWLDGAALTDVEQGYGATVSFTFTKD